MGTAVGAAMAGVGVAGGDWATDDAAAAAEAPPGSELGSCRPLSRTNVVGVPPLMVPFVAVCPNVSTSWHCASWHHRHTLVVSPAIAEQDMPQPMKRHGITSFSTIGAAIAQTQTCIV